MKKFIIPLITSFTLSFVFISQPGYSTVWTIEASNFVFTPNELPSVQLGDTIRWVWIEGSHTTTSSTIPLGATSWDVPLTSSSTEYTYVPTVAGTYNYVCTPHASFGMVGNFTVMEASGIFDFENNNLVRVFPNPFSTSTTIEYTLSQPQTVILSFYNQFGRKVDRIVHQQQAGKQQEVWSPELPGGVYYFRVKAGEQVASGKVVFMR